MPITTTAVTQNITVSNLNSGTITSDTIVGGTLQNLASGTINALASGTITGGTLQNLVSGTINAGTFTQNPLNGTILTTAVAIGVGTTPIPATVLTNRKSLIIYNTGTATIYLGGTTVTSTSGIPVGTSDYSIPIDLGTVVLYGVGATTGGTAVVMEIS